MGITPHARASGLHFPSDPPPLRTPRVLTLTRPIRPTRPHAQSAFSRHISSAFTSELILLLPPPRTRARVHAPGNVLGLEAPLWPCLCSFLTPRGSSSRTRLCPRTETRCVPATKFILRLHFPHVTAFVVRTMLPCLAPTPYPSTTTTLANRRNRILGVACAIISRYRVQIQLNR